MFSENSLAFYTIEAKKKLHQKRFEHSVSVAKTAAKLAKLNGVSEYMAFAAGILHDILKEETEENQLKFLEQNGIILSREQMKCPKVWHAYAGAVYIENTLGIQNSELYSAVYYHTTGRESMSALEKIIFISDLISEDRSFEGVAELRALAFESLDEAVKKGLEKSISYVRQKGEIPLDDSIKAYRALLKE